METQRTHGRDRRKALSRLTRLGDVPVVVMLAWAGWLAVPWSLGGLAQARAAAAAAAEAVPPPAQSSPTASQAAWRPLAATAPSKAWGIPAPEVQSPALAVAPASPEADVRARLAGEVHDAAGHGLAAIAMQAGLALVALDDDPEQARESLLAIRETSLSALTQLRAALDRLDPHGAAAAGEPEDLAGLIAGVRAAGLPVDVEPAGPTVPAHLRGTVYRVVRESLTNVLRHAGPTRALVRVANDPCEFVLEVADRGVGWTGAADGRGLAGMRAGVTSAGGLFAAGPREGGGFHVVARFPQCSA
ncbi:sensor histidine kinase [Nonomuraea sp. LPB2021202275-12-8]|uniref:sensor histidine kinase n=1 Tax=Nonomuraea sp. LPB2021202275-12-8 TaxID=3120159 RepID=UPI00300C7C58